MARIRYLKPDFFVDDDLSDLNFETRLGFAGLWCHADKSGRLEDQPRKLKAIIFPYDKVDFEKILEALTKKPFIHRYTIDNRNYIQIINWEKHQKPHHTEKQSIIPPPLINPQDKENGKENGECSSSIPELSNRSLTVKQRFTVPTIEEIKTYCAERNNTVDPQQFLDHYTSNGWKVGRNPMKDWKAAVHTWEKNGFNHSTTSKESKPVNIEYQRTQQYLKSIKQKNVFGGTK